MAPVKLLCYCNGCMETTREGVSYSIPASYMFKFNKGRTYADLLAKLYEKMNILPIDFHLKLICRLPVVSGHGSLMFSPWHITDDEDVDTMLEIPETFPGINVVELYVEKETTQHIPAVDTSFMWSGLGPYSTLLSQDTPPVHPPNTDLHSQIDHYGASTQYFPYGGGFQSSYNTQLNEAGTSTNYFPPEPEFFQSEPQNKSTYQQYPETDCTPTQSVDTPAGTSDATDRNPIMTMVANESNAWDTDGVNIDSAPLDHDELHPDDELIEELENMDDDDEPIDAAPVQEHMRLHEPPAPWFNEMGGINEAVATAIADMGHNPMWDGNVLEKGQQFVSKDALREAVLMFHIQNNQQFRVVETDRKIWSLRCKSDQSTGCKWMLRACVRKKHNQWEITKYVGPHTCLFGSISQDNVHLTSQVMATSIRHLIREEPDTNIGFLKTHIEGHFKYVPSYKKVWIAKQKALEIIFGDWDTSYQMLPKFMHALQTYNPGTMVDWEHKEGAPPAPGAVTFKYVFWSFKPCRDGFAHCRPVISIDGTFLYSKYKHKMLIAVAVDGNNQLFPLAYAIVDEETKDSWIWFLRRLKTYIVRGRRGICLYSDRAKSIIQAVRALPSWNEPNAYHRFCLRHFTANFQTTFKNAELRNIAMSAGMARQVRKFNQKMDRIETRNAEARRWLEQVPLQQWTLSHDGGRSYGQLTTNLSECFNSVLKGARTMPITALVQLTFYRCVRYFNERRANGLRLKEKGQNVTDYCSDMLTKYGAKANSHSIRSFDRRNGVFSIVSMARAGKGDNTQVVRLNDRYCSCGKLTIYHMPCSHVIAACKYLKMEPNIFLDKVYSIDEYVNTWSYQFNPLYHEDYWPEPDFPVLLPDTTRLREKHPGRRKSTRIRSEMDLPHGDRNVNYHCGLCGATGHDRRSCPARRTDASHIGPSQR